MRLKTCPAAVKAVEVDEDTDTPTGVFTAYVATWDLDSVGDKISKGAFSDDLKSWAARAKDGAPMPVIWSHMHADPNAHIGWVLEAKEDDRGLWIKGQIDVEAPAPSHAAQVWRLLKGGRIDQFSFAYDVLEGQWHDEKDADGADRSYYELRKLKTYEVGPCLIGANQATELLSAKSADGRDLDVRIGGVSAAESVAVRAAVRAALGELDRKSADIGVKAADALRSASGRLEAALAEIKGVLTDTPQTTDAPDEGAPADGDTGSQPAPGAPADSAPVEEKSTDTPTGSAPVARHRLETELAAQRFALELELL